VPNAPPNPEKRASPKTLRPVPKYVSTPQAARALGVSVRSFQRWMKLGLIEPDHRTPGGHGRWDVERLREEMRNPSRFREA